MKRFHIAAAICFFCITRLPAQMVSFTAHNSYLIPQTIYVGDRSRLVVSLEQIFMEIPVFVSANPESLFKQTGLKASLETDLVLSETLRENPDLIISRIELEHRNGSPRLLIDFVPYSTGIIHLPSLIIPDINGFEINGLSVTVASILQPNDASLAGLAPLMSAPGTGLIIYSALAAVLVIIFLCIFAAIWYKNHFAQFRKRLQRRRLLKAMDRLIKQLRIESHEKGNYEELFSILSREFREFISLFTGIDCRALTPGEFISIEIPETEFFGSVFLFETFSRWDGIRFGGSKVASPDFIAVLDETFSFIRELDLNERRARKAS